MSRLALIGLLISSPLSVSPEPCPVTPAVRAAPARDPNADPFGEGPWYVNADRTLWAWAGSETGSWVSGGRGNKVMWIRPRGTRLEVTGRRLDGNAPPLSGRHSRRILLRIPGDRSLLSGFGLLGDHRPGRQE